MGRYLTDQQIETFRRDGFVVVRGMYGPDVMAQIDLWTSELEEAPDRRGYVWKYFENSLTEPGKKILNRIENFCAHHRAFDEFVRGSRMAGPIADLLGEPAVLFKDKINFKMPGGGGFTPHQDVQAGWDRYASFFITMLVSIDRATEENGCLELASGFHNKGLIGDYWAPLTDENTKGMTFVPCPTEPGDVVFFDSFAPHKSGPNLSPHKRRVLYITYNRASEGDHLAQYYADKFASYPPDIEREPGKEYRFRV